MEGAWYSSPSALLIEIGPVGAITNFTLHRWRGMLCVPTV